MPVTTYPHTERPLRASLPGGISFSMIPRTRYNLPKSSLGGSVIIVGVEANRRLSPARSPIKPVTPSSVKILMVVEAGVIGFLAYWIISEYTFNTYFQVYVDQLIGTHITTFTAALGLSIGLAGSAVVAAAMYRNLKHAKYRLETVAAPKIRGAVDKILSGLPTLEELQRPRVARDSAVSPTASSPAAQKLAPVPVSPEQKQIKLDDTKS